LAAAGSVVRAIISLRVVMVRAPVALTMG